MSWRKWTITLQNDTVGGDSLFHTIKTKEEEAVHSVYFYLAAAILLHSECGRQRTGTECLLHYTAFKTLLILETGN